MVLKVKKVIQGQPVLLDLQAQQDQPVVMVVTGLKVKKVK